MHELSIAQSIIEIVKEHVPQEKAEVLKSIVVEVGDVSGVVADSLQFCFDAIKSENEIANAELIIRKVPFVLYCNKCKIETSNTSGIRMCETCKEFDTEILSGTEMQIVEVELN